MQKDWKCILINKIIFDFEIAVINAIGAVSFIPALWNVHEEAVTCNPRTNNTVEGWNNKLRHHRIEHQHPTIWKLIKVLQMEEAYTETVVAQLQIGSAPQTAQRVHIELQARLQRICVSLPTQERNLDNYLRAVGHNIRF